MQTIVDLVLWAILIPVLFLGRQMISGRSGRGNLTSMHGYTVIRTILVPMITVTVTLYLIDGAIIPLSFRLPDWLRLAGLMVFVIGALLRAWAHHVLGKFWSADLSLRDDHVLMQQGPYLLFQHPIYASYWPLACGLSLVTGNVIIGTLAAAYALVSFMRVPAEEALLQERFGALYHEHATAVRDHQTQLVIGTLIANTAIGAVWEIVWILRP